MLSPWTLAILLLGNAPVTPQGQTPGATQNAAIYGANATFTTELSARLGSSVVLLQAATAVSKSDASAGEKAYNEGREHYQSMLFEEAIAPLTQARKTFESANRTRSDWPTYYATLLYLSRTLEGLGRVEEADQILDAVGRMQPAIDDVLQEFPPDFRTRVVQRIRHVPARTGAVRVESVPQSATVFVNGRARGRTPLVIEHLPGGAHFVTLEMKGFAPLHRQVEITAGFGIGAEATPHLVETRLSPQADDTVAAVKEQLAAQQVPGPALTAAMHQAQRNAGRSFTVFVLENDERTTLALLSKEGVWFGPEVLQAGALASPPLRERMSGTVENWLRPPAPVSAGGGAVKPAEAPLEPSLSAPKKSSAGVWLWTGIGVVVAGGVTAAAIAASSGEKKSSSGEVEILW
jgi:hypothetical protein